MIYDCFTFFNELDLLEIRLNVLRDCVDKFVLVESTHTHSNKPKPLFYEENKDRFVEFADRIVHVISADVPTGDNHWTREHHQRKCIARGLFGCHPTDTVMVSDLDEIPRPTDVKHVDRPTEFRQFYCYYFLNFVCGDAAWWSGTKAWPYEAFGRRGFDAQYVRATGADVVIENGGWHFGYLGGAEAVKTKIDAFSHGEFARPPFNEIGNIEEAIRDKKDPYGRLERFRVASMDMLPEYVQKNREKYSHLLYREDGQ